MSEEKQLPEELSTIEVDEVSGVEDCYQSLMECVKNYSEETFTSADTSGQRPIKGHFEGTLSIRQRGNENNQYTNFYRPTVERNWGSIWAAMAIPRNVRRVSVGLVCHVSGKSLTVLVNKIPFEIPGEFLRINENYPELKIVVRSAYMERYNADISMDILLRED